VAQVTETQATQSDIAAQVADLKAATSDNFRQVRQAQDAAPKVSLANGRPMLTTADGNFSFALRTVVQFDAAHSSVHPLTTANDIGAGTNFRRARLGFDGTAFKDWNFALWAEFGGTGGESPILNQAYIEYTGFHPFGPSASLRLRAGAWATPAGLEDATSNTEGLFLERAAVAELVRGLDAGDGRTGVGAFASGERWYASAVLTGKVVGVPTTAEHNQQGGYVLRAALNPFHGLDYDVHLGGGVQGVIEPADTAAGPTVTESLRLQERPELRVDTLRLVDTGAITANGLTAYNLEAGASWRSLYVAGEWYRIDVRRNAAGSLFDPSFNGWYLQGAWTLTGERHVWSSANGGFRGIRPAKPFDRSKGQWGAFEAAVRYSVLDLNDHAGTLGAATPAGGIRGGKQAIWTAGLNWHPNNTIRFLFDYQHVRVRRLNAAGGDIGETVNAISLRSQFAF
jgi:phosphate-selective porin OprO/OprP